jgi:hypothetical protein
MVGWMRVVERRPPASRSVVVFREVLRYIIDCREYSKGAVIRYAAGIINQAKDDARQNFDLNQPK